MNQSEFEANACNRRQARENTCGQSQSLVKQNQSNYQITFDTKIVNRSNRMFELTTELR